jgi:hypothetical protein
VVNTFEPPRQSVNVKSGETSTVYFSERIDYAFLPALVGSTYPYIYFSAGQGHTTDDFNHAVVHSSYKSLPSMHEKVASQMDLSNKIRAVDIEDVARLVIERHFIRDTRGNLRKFSQQGFRCSSCNSKFRREEKERQT